MKLNKIKLALQSLLLQFSSVSTDGGLLQWDGDSELPEVGEAVWSVDENGERVEVEDGTYTTEDGTKIVVKDGKVEEVIVPETEPADSGSTDDTTEAPAEDTPDSTEAPAEDPETLEEEEPAEEAPVEEAPAEEDEALKRIAALEELVAKLEERLAALEGKPAGEPAEETFRRIERSDDLFKGDKKIERLKKLYSK